MRKLLLIPTFIGALAFGQTEERVKHPPTFVHRCATHYYIVEPVKLMPYLIRYHEKLNLTKEQKKEIKELIREIKTAIIPLDIEINRVSKKLRNDMVFVDNKNLVEAEMRYLADLKVKRSLYNYKCIHSLKKILTKEQFDKLLHLAGLN